MELPGGDAAPPGELRPLLGGGVRGIGGRVLVGDPARGEPDRAEGGEERGERGVRRLAARELRLEPREDPRRAHLVRQGGRRAEREAGEEVVEALVLRQRIAGPPGLARPVPGIAARFAGMSRHSPSPPLAAGGIID
ncbi:MAG: hypothetical protein AB1726_01215 [Planctomycetota bacterium]